MEKTIYDCIIVGGGISGISFAHYMKSTDQNILLLEKNSKAGGQIQSIASERISGYWRELGSHTCYNSYIQFLSILKDTGSEDIIQPLNKVSYVLYDDKIKSIFSGMSIISCILHTPKMFFSKKDKTGKTVKEYFISILGNKNYNKLLTNAFSAVICQPADDYPAEMFLKKRKDKFEEYPRKYTLKGGLSSFIETIIEKDKLSIQTDSEVISVQKQDNIYIVRTSNGDIYQTKNIAFAYNPKALSGLISDIEPEVGNLLSTIPSFGSESVNIIIEKDKLQLKPVAGIISLSDEFMSAVSRDTIENEKYRSFTFHFEKGKKSKQEKMDIICKVLNINLQEIIEQVTVEHELPSARIQHLYMDKQIEKIKQNDSVYILGNYFYGLSLEDCVHRSNDEFERYKGKMYI